MNSDYAILHRGAGKPPWRFAPDPVHHILTHTTRYGRTYSIMEGVSVGKPFWVAMLIDDRAWVTVERELKARSIEFGGGGEYRFPEWMEGEGE